MRSSLLSFSSVFMASALLSACGDKDGDTGAADLDASIGGLDCSEGYCVLSGTITEDMTLTADNVYLLRGGVFIGDDVNETTLTIEAGVTVYGETSTDGMLVVTRGSKLYAEGTAEAPIVFTSSKAEGSRARGDWGGLIINGRAPINVCADDESAACEAYGEGGTGWYGGDDAADDSGVLKYVRVEFAGTLVSPDNELNGIAFQGVGSGTTIDYVQVHMNADDGVEFFGGTAQAKHLVVTGVGDDGLDWTDGWQGKLQFVVLQQYSDNGDNGFESDNNGDANDAEPRSNPTISNVTVVGSPDSEASDLGMLLREGTAGALSNVLVTSFGEACIDIDHDATWSQANSGALTLTHSLVDCATDFQEDEDEVDSVEAWFLGQSGNLSGDPMLGDPTNAAAPDWVPASGSPVLGAGSAPADGFFDAADYIGAIGADDWTAGWTTAVAN